MKSIARCLSVLAAALALAACELPREGPGRALVENTAYSPANTAGFVLVNVNREVADYLRVEPEPGFGDRFGRGQPVRADRIGIGDVLLIRIWEADPAGLFSSTGLVDKGEIPAVQVDGSGLISIPYAGDIQAAGRTPRQVSELIVERLRDKTVEPQAHVTRVENVANVVTLTGDVGNPGIYPLTSSSGRSASRPDLCGRRTVSGSFAPNAVPDWSSTMPNWNTGPASTRRSTAI
jgi:polysaccharide biosynthesis/export protein